MSTIWCEKCQMSYPSFYQGVNILTLCFACDLERKYLLNKPQKTENTLHDGKIKTVHFAP